MSRVRCPALILHSLIAKISAGQAVAQVAWQQAAGWGQPPAAMLLKKAKLGGGNFAFLRKAFSFF